MKKRFLEAYRVVGNFVLEHLKAVIIIGICFLLLLTWFLISVLRTYKDYNVKSEIILEDSDGTAYESFDGNILKYNSDGAFYVTTSGDVIWNETFDISTPIVDKCEDYLALYEKGGTKIYVMMSTGSKGLIETNRPIVKACVDSSGNVAVLMSDKNTSQLQVTDVDGDVIAAGVIHAKNSGYPIDIEYSDDGERLVLSEVDIKSGNVTTTLVFYDFSSKGQKEKDNIMGTYSFSDMIIPRLHFMSNGSLVSFGDREIAVFSDSSKPKLKKEIFAESSIDTVFYNDDYFGYVGAETTDKGETVKMIHAYGKSGFEKFDKPLDVSYTHCEMLENDDILFSDEKELSIFTIHGIKKFNHSFEDNLIKVIPNGGRKEFIFIQNGIAEKARLR